MSMPKLELSTGDIVATTKSTDIQRALQISAIFLKTDWLTFTGPCWTYQIASHEKQKSKIKIFKDILFFVHCNLSTGSIVPPCF